MVVGVQQESASCRFVQSEPNLTFFKLLWGNHMTPFLNGSIHILILNAVPLGTVYW
jgi:hypothetical protein